MGTGLYIHVPFCLARCHFCAFYLQVFNEQSAQRYLTALSKEIRLHADQGSLGGRSVETVYFGGGTPTIMTPTQLRVILDHIRHSFEIHPNAEVTVEAHPDTVSFEDLQELRRTGFNRISCGIQSTDEQELLRVGRLPLGTSSFQTVDHARRAGFTNINVDVMYGLPGQTMESWESTLEAVLSLAPTHLSCYALTVEEGTKLDRDVDLGRLAGPDPDLQNSMEDAAAQKLVAAGFQRYEISNYSRPGYTCRHNLHYWTGDDYLGLGPSSQSYLNGRRFGDVEDLTAYVRTLETECLPVVERETLNHQQRQREAVVFGLRLLEGVERKAVEAVTDRWWESTFMGLMSRGLLEERSGKITLTDFGRRHADSVAVELL